MLTCPACEHRADAAGLPTVCDRCGSPWLVRYPDRVYTLTDRAEVRRHPGGMWRWRPFLPIAPGEEPVSLGEGDTPLLSLPRAGQALGFTDLWLKDEGANPTGSFKSRGLSAAITRARYAGASAFTIPTAGNAGVAASAYAARAGLPVRVFAPATTPAVILAQIEAYGADLVLVEGHIGDCGRLSREWAAESGAMDLSTLREPYRIEGKKTLGLELAMQLSWKLPDAIIYPAGGGTGLIGMWKAFRELLEIGWVAGDLPRMFAVQSTGCAPLVRAFESGSERCEPWQDPWTTASGLRVPAPLGDRLMLDVVRASGGAALAVSDEELTSAAERITRAEGIDLSPEGGATVAAAVALRERGVLAPEARVVLFNTGAGWLYRRFGDWQPGRTG